MKKPLSAGQKEEAYKRLEKSTNDELKQVAAHILGYDAFELDRKKLILPSETRARVLKILKHKIQTDQITFTKNE